VGQASSQAITDDGQDARPNVKLSFGGVPRHARLHCARNDNLSPHVTEELPPSGTKMLPNGAIS
jgi:hypothetical protein